MTEKKYLDCLIAFPRLIPEYYDRVRPEYFSDPHYRAIYNGIVGVYLDGKEPEIWSVREWLVANGQATSKTLEVLAGVGDFPNLADLPWFGEAIYRNWLSRQVISRLESARGQATRDPVGAYDSLKADLDGLFDSRGAGYMELPELVAEGEAYRKDLAERKIKRSQISIPVLEDCVPFLTHKNYVFISSYVRTGKTTLAIDLSVNLIRSGDKGIYYTLESNADNLANRFIAQMGNLPYKYIEDLTAFENEVFAERYKTGKSDLLNYKDNLIIRDDVFDLDSIFNFAIFQKRKNGLDFIVIDYMGLLSFGGRDEYEALTEFSKKIARFKKKHDLNIIALQQIPNSFMDKNRNPNMIPGKSSGQMGADADIVLFLERQDYTKHECFLHVMKNKLMGHTKTAPVYYNQHWNRLISLADAENEGVK